MSYLCEVRFLVVAVIKSKHHVKIIVAQDMSDGVQHGSKVSEVVQCPMHIH